MVAQRGTCRHVLQRNVPNARTEVQLLFRGDHNAAGARGEGVRGPEVFGGAGHGTTYAPSQMHSASSMVLSSLPNPDSPATSQRAGKGAAGQGQVGTVPAGTGEGGAGGGHEEVRVGQAAGEAQRADGRGGQRGEPGATGPRADPFNPAESDRASALVVANILEVSEEEGGGWGKWRSQGTRGSWRRPMCRQIP